jgi:hypothetical protein
VKRLRLLAIASIAALLCACGSPAHTVHQSAAAHASSPAAAPATQRFVVRAVTASGTLAAGFTASHESVPVSCALGPAASPAAVDDDIVACTPESSYAVACWAAADPGHVYCLRNPWTDDVVELPVADRVPHVSAPQHPQPLGLTLADGTHCSLRSGGASSELAAHPTWFAAFICATTTAVWAAPNTDGIDTSARAWSVQIAPLDGTGPLVTSAVADVYYAGTAR